MIKPSTSNSPRGPRQKAPARPTSTKRSGTKRSSHKGSGPSASKQGGKDTARATRGPAREAQPAPAWLLRCAPGLSRLLRGELRHRKLLRADDRVDTLWQRNHDLMFLPRLAQAPAAGDLRLAEDVARCPMYGRYKISPAQIDRLAKSLAAQGKQWRLVVTAEGTHFNRHDVQRYLARELHARRIAVRDDAARTAFIYLVDQAFYAAVPVHGAQDAPGRDQRQRERGGSLPPTIAAAMAFLARPEAKDTILDPVCGSGTLLAEAQALAPGATLHGRDLDGVAVKTATANLPDLGGGSLHAADARDIDLPDGSISLALANLPFGKQFGDADENPALYRDVLAELRRLATPKGWRAVFLVGAPDMLADAAADTGLRVVRQINVRVRGEPASIVLIDSGHAAHG